MTIGGQSFYQVDILGNTSGDKTKTQYVYFKIVDQHHLLLLQLSTPYANESTYDALQKNIALFLAGIQFPEKFDFQNESLIDVADADIKVIPPAESLVDYRSNFFPYN